MKKFLISLMAFSVLVLFTGCGAKETIDGVKVKQVSSIELSMDAADESYTNSLVMVPDYEARTLNVSYELNYFESSDELQDIDTEAEIGEEFFDSFLKILKVYEGGVTFNEYADNPTGVTNLVMVVTEEDVPGEQIDVFKTYASGDAIMIRSIFQAIDRLFKEEQY